MLAWKTACLKVGQWLWQASQPEKPASQSASQSAKRNRQTSQPERPRTRYLREFRLALNMKKPARF